MAPARERVVAVEIGRPLVGHFLDVGPRREGLFAGAGDHRAALRLVGPERGEGGDQLLEHAARQRVEGLGAVERDEGYGATLLDQDRFAHTTPNASIASATF